MFCKTLANFLLVVDEKENNRYLLNSSDIALMVSLALAAGQVGYSEVSGKEIEFVNAVAGMICNYQKALEDGRIVRDPENEDNAILKFDAKDVFEMMGNRDVDVMKAFIECAIGLSRVSDKGNSLNGTWMLRGGDTVEMSKYLRIDTQEGDVLMTIVVVNAAGKDPGVVRLILEIFPSGKALFVTAAAGRTPVPYLNKNFPNQ